uniref:Uncharacterized protein n=2 Tax=Physcomitrium patens TaxID=3218 RepID=A9S8R0_PHYPA
MANHNLIRIWNFTNTRVVNYNKIIEMYKDFIKSKLSYINFTIKKQMKLIITIKSNNKMDAFKFR